MVKTGGRGEKNDVFGFRALAAHEGPVRRSALAVGFSVDELAQILANLAHSPAP